VTGPVAPLSPEALSAHAARHVAFLEERLVSPAAHLEWRQNLAAVWSALLATRVTELVPGPALAAAVESCMTPEVVRRGLRPALHASALLASARLSEDEARLGRYVPSGASPKIEALLALPGLVPERLVREVMEHPAVEAVMRDVLYDALTEFSDKVNPFFAEWGLPGLLKRFAPFGMGAMNKAFESVRAEFDRRLEPEIRKFLQGFTRRALKKSGDFVVAKADGPEFISLRRSLWAWLVEQRVTDLVAGPTDPRTTHALEAFLDAVEHTIALDSTREEIRAAIELAVAAHSRQTLGEAMAAYGVTLAVDTDAIADASWPVLVIALSSIPVRTWIRGMVHEFYEAEAARSTG
jgi:hypothetical protein